MTGIELLGFVVTPLLVLGAGLAVYFVTGWLDRGTRARTPAE